MATQNPTPCPDKPSSYQELVTCFPPRVIRSRAACQRTNREVERLDGMPRPLGTDEKEYRDLLATLVSVYRGAHQRTGPLTLLEQLLEEHQLRRSDLSRILGKSLSLCSMILNGQRAITREHAIRLGRYFGKGPELFLSGDTA